MKSTRAAVLTIGAGAAAALMLSGCSSQGEVVVERLSADYLSMTSAAGISMNLGVAVETDPIACSQSTVLSNEFPSGCELTALTESQTGPALDATLDYSVSDSFTSGSDFITAWKNQLSSYQDEEGDSLQLDQTGSTP